ncbi:quinone reductase [Elsinoe ampelina]|uniref:Quinone reductase n=1 Tax=Elsinoe ampelina TaxID=302913 RepID=A0A6A6G4T2_9PEZI|nr:quinone reductase [Elsinoe ampelina]
MHELFDGNSHKELYGASSPIAFLAAFRPHRYSYNHQSQGVAFARTHTMSGKHLAAVSLQKGEPLTIQERETPTPGANEILIEVKAVAINPVDYYQRDYGMPPVSSYPACFGSDAAGVVVKVGSAVPSSAPQPGTRVFAFASAFYQDGRPEYGAFQQFALAQSECVVVLPEQLSFEQGASLPVAALTALTAYTTVGIPLDTRHSAKDKQAILVWGAAASVGTFAVQTAKILGFTVYATASSKHHAYIKDLGADKIYDYHDADVVKQIVDDIEKDGVKLQTAHVVVTGGLEPTLEVLKATKDNGVKAVVSHSPMLPEGHPTLDNTEIKFNFPPASPKERDAHFADVFQGWLAGKFEAGSVVPSPPVEVVGRGLKNLNEALDVVRGGVSLKKIVISL